MKIIQILAKNKIEKIKALLFIGIVISAYITIFPSKVMADTQNFSWGWGSAPNSAYPGQVISITVNESGGGSFGVNNYWDGTFAGSDSTPPRWPSGLLIYSFTIPSNAAVGSVHVLHVQPSGNNQNIFFNITITAVPPGAVNAPAIPSSLTQLQFLEKQWNPTDTSSQYYGNVNDSYLYSSDYTNTLKYAFSNFQLCERSTTWINDIPDYDAQYQPNVSECAKAAASALTNGAYAGVDKSVGTPDPNGPLVSEREYVFRLLMDDSIGNYTIANTQNGRADDGKNKGGIDIGAPWAQVYSGNVYASDGINMNVQNVPPANSFLKTQITGITNYFITNGTCNYGAGSLHLGFESSNCNAKEDSSGQTAVDNADNTKTQNVKMMATQKYPFSYFLSICQQNGECNSPPSGGDWDSGAGGANASSGDYVLPKDLTTSGGSGHNNSTNGWIYIPGNLYVNFNPTGTNCKGATAGNKCVPDVNNPIAQPNTSTYTGRAIILVGGDLYIAPDLIYQTSNDGYIFIVNGEIRILATNPYPKASSNKPIHQDVVQGFFYTQNNFTVDRQKCYVNGNQGSGWWGIGSLNGCVAG